MTVIPIVVALLVVGIAKSAEAAQAGRVAGRSVLWIVIICTASAIFGAVATIGLTDAFPLPRATAALLQAALANVDKTTVGRASGAGRILQGGYSA